jgi:hypothetical protein
MAQQQEREVWYEPHPVTPARKKELVAAGYRIVDARYAPPGWVRPGADVALTPTDVVLTDADAAADLAGKPRPDNHGRSSWAENESPLRFMETEASDSVVAPAPSPASYTYDADVMAPFATPTSAELRAKLDAAGIEYQKHAPKAKLVELAAGL